MFVKSVIFFAIIGAISPLIYSAYKYVNGELKTGSDGEDEFIIIFGPILGGLLGAIYFVIVPIAVVCFIVMFVLDSIKNKINKEPITDELLGMIHKTLYAEDVFNRIKILKKSKFSSGMMLDEYKKELEQVVLTIGTKPNSRWSGFSIPFELRQKFKDIVKEFSDLVDISEKQINQYETDERKKIAEVNLKAMDEIHELLKSIKKDKLDGKV